MTSNIPHIDKIAKITKICFESGKFQITFALNGLDDVEMQLLCNTIHIADDGSTVTLKDFTSNMAFLENAANAFGAKEFAVPVSIRDTVKMVKKVFDV